jgi:hypothetical protein
MKLKETNFEDIIVGAEKTMDFTIDTDNSLIFEILRDKMYKDKIGSICREVMSNCRDANRESGSDKSIAVTIIEPNQYSYIGHQSVSFRDNGIGITPERMFNVYINYASSTKRNSNSQTGGFGLGAKTPFAYNDTFTVITVCDVDGVRMKYYYTALIDSSRKGKMVLFDSEESGEETGTQVIVPIKTPNDRVEFEEKAFFYSKYWGCVDYENFRTKPEIPEILYSTPEFDIVTGDSVGLVIDGIPYPFENSSSWGFKNLRMANGMAVSLKFNTGELTISANRESVQYDESTIAILKERCELVYDTLSTEFESFTDNFESYVEACMFKASLERGDLPEMRKDKVMFNILTCCVGASKGYTSYMLTSLYNNTELSYQGRKLVSKLKFIYHLLEEVNNLSYKYAGKRVYRQVDSLSMKQISKGNLYYGDYKRDSRRNATIFKESGEHSFMLITPKTCKLYNSDEEIAQEYEDMVNLFGMKLESYEAVVPLKVVRGSSEIKPSKIPAYEYHTYKNSALDLYFDKKVKKFYKDEDFMYEFSTEKVCFLFVNNIRNSTEAYKIDLNFILEEGWKVLLINHSYESKFKGADIKQVSQVRALIEAPLKDEWIKRAKYYVLRTAVCEVEPNILSHLETIGSLVLPKTYESFPKEWEDLSIENLKSYNRVWKEIKLSREGLSGKIRKNLNKYPMLLSYLKYNNDPVTEQKSKIEQYINLIQKHEG